MNGIERIIDKITGDTLAEIDAINDRAREEVEKSNSESLERRKARVDAILAAGEAEAREQRKRLNRVSELEAKKDTLAVKQEMIDKAFLRAEEKLRALPEEDYVALLAKMAASVSRDGTEELVFSEAEKEAIGGKTVRLANELLAQKGRPAALRLSDGTCGINGGLIVKSGRVDVNCSFETLLRLSRGELTGRVAEILFG